tara:strand:- start:73 stop:450 length:378 start_codon:yes stop_codon:yes gene_type:complete
MKDNKRTQRTPQEIIADTEARLERLLTREAKQTAKTNPEVAALYAERDAIQKDIREAKKILGDSPQSGTARIAKHQVWIDRINAEMVGAFDALDASEAALTVIDSSIGDAVKTLMKTSKENSSEA